MGSERIERRRDFRDDDSREDLNGKEHNVIQVIRAAGPVIAVCVVSSCLLLHAKRVVPHMDSRHSIAQLRWDSSSCISGAAAQLYLAGPMARADEMELVLFELPASC